MSGVDLTTVSVSYYSVSTPGTKVPVTINSGELDLDKKILTKSLGLGSGDYVLVVSVKDKTGNTGETSRRFKVN